MPSVFPPWLLPTTSFATLQTMPLEAWHALGARASLPERLLDRWVADALVQLQAAVTSPVASPPIGTRSLARLLLRQPMSWAQRRRYWPLMYALGPELPREVTWALPPSAWAAAHQATRELYRTVPASRWGTPTGVDRAFLAGLGWSDLADGEGTASRTPGSSIGFCDVAPFPAPFGVHPVVPIALMALSPARLGGLLLGEIPPVTLGGLQLLLTSLPITQDDVTPVGRIGDALAWWAQRVRDPGAVFGLAQHLLVSTDHPRDWPDHAPTPRAVGLILLACLASDPHALALEDLARSVAQWLRRHSEHPALLSHWPVGAVPLLDRLPWWVRLRTSFPALPLRLVMRQAWGPLAGTLSWPIWWDASFTAADAVRWGALLVDAPPIPIVGWEAAAQGWWLRTQAPDLLDHPDLVALRRRMTPLPLETAP